ncbi:MAG: NAD(P)/FAD-dependent oxidoreductase [Alkalinema sp. RU_4_3]|nr:NAD(P)/FAD-dependent oxidoreductase [Alkalinema sp. RU_4_3]
MIYGVIVVGAGLAGSSAAIQLAQEGLSVLLLEQQRYPAHKLCGEFLSVEVIANFVRLGVTEAIAAAHPHQIRNSLLTTCSGARFEHPLPGVALGLSRYQLDLLLFERAIAAGAICYDGTTVKGMEGDFAQGFSVVTSRGEFRSRMVLAAHGKRSTLDQKLNRRFVRKKSPWVAFKAHCEGLVLPGMIELHSFPGGYCGLSMIETGQVNLCWIGHERVLQHSDRNLPDALYENPALRDRLKPLRIVPTVRHRLGQISFAMKGNFEGDICAIGDTAGMITPLCGDGMAMALRSAELAVPLAIDYLSGGSARAFKRQYAQDWRREFRSRLQLGRLVHAGFVRPGVAEVCVGVCGRMPEVGNWLIRNTRGEAVAH